MGKLKELLDEYKKCSKGSSRESELTTEIYKIVDWMKENGHLDKPFKLPRKGGWSFGAPFFPDLPKEDGDYCGHCLTKLPELTREVSKCVHCGWGIGVVYLVSNTKDLNTMIRRV